MNPKAKNFVIALETGLLFTAALTGGSLPADGRTIGLAICFAFWPWVCLTAGDETRRQERKGNKKAGTRAGVTAEAKGTK